MLMPTNPPMKIKLAQTRAKIMSLFSDSVSLEGLFRLFQFVAWGAGVLALLALLGKDVTQRMIADRKAKEAIEERKLRDKAETKLARVIDDFDQREAAKLAVNAYSRTIRLQCLISELGSDAPKGVVIRVLYQTDPLNLAEPFAHKIWLGLSLAGWPLAKSSVELWEGNTPLDPTGVFTMSDRTRLFISPRTSNRTIADGSVEARLVRALATCGANFETMKASSPDTILLLIGPPPPYNPALIQ
jgi:hypothetical protein